MNVATAFKWLHEFSLIFGELCVQNLILVGSAFIGIWTLGSSSRQERRRATVDLVLNQLQDEPIMAQRQTLRQLIETKRDLPAILDLPTSPAPAPERVAVLTILNLHEFMASGVREGAFDEKTYKRLFYTMVVDHWKHLSSFVVKYRDEKGETLYQDFQWLAKKWEKNPLRSDSKVKTRTVITKI